MKLTDLACKNAKAKERQYKLADGNSLFLEVRKNGGRYFRWRYLYAGKERTLTIGAYPKVSLLEARKAAQVARDKLNAGTDPAAQKQIEKLTLKLIVNTTFKSIAEEWIKKMTTRCCRLDRAYVAAIWSPSEPTQQQGCQANDA